MAYLQVNVNVDNHGFHNGYTVMISLIIIGGLIRWD
jgi:hypothetical protein